MAEPIKALATGAWGAEVIPECAPEIAVMASAVFRAVMTGELLSASALYALDLVARDNPDADPTAWAEAIDTAGEMLAARARRHVDPPAAAACDGSGSPSCGICGSLTTRQSECAGRLYGGVLTGNLDLTVIADCWTFLAKGPEAVVGLTWDDFQPARTAALRMVQARARRLQAAPTELAAAAA